MKTVLIVEDEKMIRQGIKTMIQRSGVPVSVIIECGNGVDALEILKGQDIDVMFTDIRMPRMDGIELVRRTQELEHIPLIVAISGYDDFSYAVEMLRNGVREYILKPVEREKIAEVLCKLNQELEHRREHNQTERRAGQQQMKYLLVTGDIPEEELALLEGKYELHFFEGGYVVCCFGKSTQIEDNDAVILLTDVEENNVCIVEEKNLELLLKNELNHVHAGISGVHHGLRELRSAYEEAFLMRKRAFCIRRTVEYGKTEPVRVQEALRQQACKLLEEQAFMQRVQLIGTEKTEELAAHWNRLFEEARRERITPQELERAMHQVLTEIGRVYRNSIEDRERSWLEEYDHIYEYEDITEYEDGLMHHILELHNRIQTSLESNGNQQKMKQAVEYIRANYNKDLNMAVVSNYISMNYSLFSFSFKQYTGTNFVNYLKDIRITEAKKLLRDTDKKIIEISQQVGYDNEKHFMKLFKSTCGVSASEYRKNMRRD